MTSIAIPCKKNKTEKKHGPPMLANHSRSEIKKGLHLHFFLMICHSIAIIIKRAICVSSADCAKYGSAKA